MNRAVSRYLWATGPIRALAESVIPVSVLLVGLLALSSQIGDHIVGQGIFFLSSLAGLVCALRLSWPTGSRWRQSGIELIVASVLGLSLFAVGSAFSELAGTFQILSRVTVLGFFNGVLALVDCAVAYIALRVFFRVMIYWNTLRRKRLVWQLTHAHVVTIAGIAVCFITVTVLISQFSGTTVRPEMADASPIAVVASRVLTTIVPIVTTLIVVAFVVAAFVLPPSAVFSYFFARRMTRRLEQLAAATNALRAGDYSVRINVGGEDEVAQLQNNFNAMAADLQKAMATVNIEKEKSDALLKSRRELIANVSHELRTPVATLRSYIESDLSQADNARPEALRHDLEIMEHEAVRLQSLIDDLFTLARVEVDSLSLDCKLLDVGPVVKRLAESFAPLAWQSGKVEIIAEVQVGLTACVDERRMEQIITNLVRNALRHTPPGGIIAVAAAKKDGWVKIEVRDTGEGIPPDDLPHLWDRFYRGHNDSTAAAGGAGLGLALVRELTEAMGGRVSVESKPGSGSSFTICFPVGE